jgi:uncharacterized protein (DUF362 family)
MFLVMYTNDSKKSIVMKSFSDIRILYDSKNNRNIEFLSSLYENDTILYDSIKSLLSKHINSFEINNKKILIKPNWVRHNIKPDDSICLCTNENFVIETVKIILEYKPASIIIGDAPIQGCKWELLLSKNFYSTIRQLSNLYSIPITIKDFRRVTFDPKNNKVEKDRNSLDNYVIFDVGKKSYLEPITDSEKRFRVTCYDPDKLAETHNFGTHKYCIIKDIFECDTIITLPKIKTHQKSGITNSLKILVGINGDKDYLPHHRMGPIEKGGDCYPGYNPLRSISELFLDKANRNIGNKKYKLYNLISRILWKLSFPTQEQTLAAGWYGNDTIWRTVFDLNLIALYGKKDGTLSDKPQRVIYSLCDGIIGGQGDGPLNPSPLPLGIIAFTNNAYLMDLIIGYIFRLNIDKIPLLKEAKKMTGDYSIYLNGEKISMDKINDISLDVIMPPGWTNYNK